MSIILCISITNNVKTCKKFNERAQTTKFSFLSRLRQELFAENPKTSKTRETKTWITQNFPIVWPKFQTLLTLSSRNSRSETRKHDKFHIFETPWTSAFLWCYPYGSDSPGREFWPKCGPFLKKLEPSCDQTWWDIFDFSIDLGQLCPVDPRNTFVWPWKNF